MDKPEEFENKAKVMLDESLDDLNPDITRRLQQARYAALEKAKSRTIWSFYPQAITAVFAVTIITITLFINLSEKDLFETELAMETEIELLTANESLDLLEDLEFMQWLAESEEYAS